MAELFHHPSHEYLIRVDVRFRCCHAVHRAPVPLSARHLNRVLVHFRLHRAAPEFLRHCHALAQVLHGRRARWSHDLAQALLFRRARWSHDLVQVLLCLLYTSPSPRDS